MTFPRFERPKSLKDAYNRFLKIHGHPREVALGLALGIFVGMTPFMGFQMLIAVFFAMLFKANKISAAAAVWISNPLTAPVLYGITYLTGAKICGLSKVSVPPHLDTSTLWALLQRTPQVLTMMIVGGAVLGLPLAVAGYYFSYKAVDKYQQEVKQKRHRKKRHKET